MRAIVSGGQPGQHPEIKASALVEALPGGQALGYDERGNLRTQVMIGSVKIVVVVDETHPVIITFWVV